MTHVRFFSLITLAFCLSGCFIVSEKNISNVREQLGDTFQPIESGLYVRTDQDGKKTDNLTPGNQFAILNKVEGYGKPSYHYNDSNLRLYYFSSDYFLVEFVDSGVFNQAEGVVFGAIRIIDEKKFRVIPMSCNDINSNFLAANGVINEGGHCDISDVAILLKLINERLSASGETVAFDYQLIYSLE